MFSASKTKQAVSGAYTLTKSLRFRASASASLARTPSSNGSSTKSTISFWTKRGALASNLNLYDDSIGSGTIFNMFFNTSDQLQIYVNGSGTGLTTTQVFRDVSSWYHIVVAIDTTQATASNRILIYINGVVVTAFTGTATYYGLNANVLINSTTDNYRICRAYDGYLAALYWIDGQALAPTSFGATDATTGVWQPKAYTGTYGTNGFYLTFANATSTTALGYDTSGNSNNLTVTSISLSTGSTYDSMNDVPMLTSATASNYCVVNPADTSTNIVVSNGNLSVSKASAVAGICKGSICASSGKWYAEFTCTSTVNYVGIASATTSKDTAYMGQGGSNSYGYYYTGQASNNGTSISGYGATYTTGDVIGVAMNLDTGTLTYYKNGTSQGVAFSSLSGSFTFAWGDNTGGISGNWNFGQQPWQYSPPSGYVALNTYNLPTPSIGATTATQAGKYFDTSLYTGSNLSVTNSGFQPDFIWFKSRSQAVDHVLYDSVRGTTKTLESNLTNAEYTNASSTAGLTAFNSSGFSIGSDTAGPGSVAGAYNYVAWQWKANTTSGFSVVTYTGTGTATTISHGLGVAPSMIIIKSRSASGDWPVYHSSVGNGSYTKLNTTAASASSSTVWNATSPTSSVFSVGVNTDSNTVTVTYVAYCFAQIAGFSAFGSYTGNGNATGPFVYLGFKPKFIMVKSSSRITSWNITDGTRNPTDSINYSVNADTAGAETTFTLYNYLSNGFQIITSDVSVNSSGETYIYMAFASNPFKYSNAY